MAVLQKGTTFATGNQVTATNLNNLVDLGTFGTDAYDDITIGLDGTGSMYVKDAGISAAKLASNSVTTAKIADANVTPAKLSTGAPTWDTTTTTIYASLDFAAISTTTTAGTYGRSGNTVTITMAGHGMSTGMVADLTFTGGTGGAATNGSYPITYVSSSQFTIIDPTSGTITGSPACSRTAYYGNSTVRGSQTVAGNQTVTKDLSVGKDLSVTGALTVAGTTVNGLTIGTAQNSTSGTSIDFTSIPSWVKRVTVMLSGVGINANTYLLVQLGDSGGIENTGYLASSVLTSGYDIGNFTTGLAGFPVYDNSHTTTATWTGSLVFTNFGSNQWICSGLVSDSDGNHVVNTAGSKTLSATLDRIRITTNSGTAAFNAGQINIMYE